MGLIRAIPAQWKRALERNKQNNHEEYTLTRQIRILDKSINIDKIKTKQVYNQLVRNFFVPPTSQSRWETTLSNNDTEWSKVYTFIHKMTIDVKLRWFQYKLLMNIIYVNKDLVKFKHTFVIMHFL